MQVKQIENEFCPVVKKPCIEKECLAFKISRIRDEEEYRSYLMSDIPVGRVINNTRYCEYLKKDIPIRFKTQS